MLTDEQKGALTYYSSLAESCGVPEHMREGLALYIACGVPPGDFLQAILENDFVRAAGRADVHNQHALLTYARFLQNNAPMASWGSESKVANWIKAGGLLPVAAVTGTEV